MEAFDLKHAKTMLAAASTAQSQQLRRIYVSSASVLVEGLESELRELRLLLAAQEKDLVAREREACE